MFSNKERLFERRMASFVYDDCHNKIIWNLFDKEENHKDLHLDRTCQTYNYNNDYYFAFNRILMTQNLIYLLFPFSY